MACSTSGFIAASSPSPAKLSPATNTTTGRLASGLVCAVAASRTFRLSAPYFTFRVKVTPAQEAAAGAGDASAFGNVSGEGVAAGAGAAGAAGFSAGAGDALGAGAAAGSSNNPA